jgi:hypothetical protein
LIVRTILEGQPEAALEMLSKHYGVVVPDLKVGTVKRHRRVLGCYVEKERRIYISKREYLSNPFVILHEFYHHLRTYSRKKQADKRADVFAKRLIDDFSRTRNSAIQGRKGHSLADGSGL